MSTWNGRTPELVMGVEPSVGGDSARSTSQQPSVGPTVIQECLRRFEEQRQKREAEEMVMAERFIQELCELPFNIQNQCCRQLYEADNRSGRSLCSDCEEGRRCLVDTHMYSSQTCPQCKEKVTANELQDLIANDPYIRYTFEGWPRTYQSPHSRSPLYVYTLRSQKVGEQDLLTEIPVEEDHMAAYCESPGSTDVCDAGDYSVASRKWEKAGDKAICLEKGYKRRGVGESASVQLGGILTEPIIEEEYSYEPDVEPMSQLGSQINFNQCVPNTSSVNMQYHRTGGPAEFLQQGSRTAYNPCLPDTCPGYISYQQTNAPGEFPQKGSRTGYNACLPDTCSEYISYQQTNAPGEFPQKGSRTGYNPCFPDTCPGYISYQQTNAPGELSQQGSPFCGPDTCSTFKTEELAHLTYGISSDPRSLNRPASPCGSGRMQQVESRISATSGSARICVTSGREGPQITVEMGPCTPYTCKKLAEGQPSPMGSAIITEEAQMQNLPSCDPCLYSERLRQKDEILPSCAPHGTMAGIDPRLNLCYLGRQAHCMSPQSFAGLLFSDVPPDAAQVPACAPGCTRGGHFPPTLTPGEVVPLPPPEVPSDLPPALDARSAASGCGCNRQPSPARSATADEKCEAIEQCRSVKGPVQGPSSAPPALNSPSPAHSATRQRSGCSNVGEAPSAAAPPSGACTPNRQASRTATPVPSAGRIPSAVLGGGEQKCSRTPKEGELLCPAKSKTSHLKVQKAPSATCSNTGAAPQERVADPTVQGKTNIPPCEMPGAILVFRPIPVHASSARPNNPVVQLALPGRGVVELTGEAVLFGACNTEVYPSATDPQGCPPPTAGMANPSSGPSSMGQRLTTVDVTVDLSRVPGGGAVQHFSRTGGCPVDIRNEANVGPISVVVEPYKTNPANPLPVASGGVSAHGRPSDMLVPFSVEGGGGGGGGLRSRSVSPTDGALLCGGCRGVTRSAPISISSTGFLEQLLRQLRDRAGR